MRSRFLRGLTILTLCGGLTVGVAGCASPDFSAMKPTVPKPSAAVVLVNHPVGWTTKTLQQMQQSDPALGILTLETFTTSDQQLQSVVDGLLQKDPPSLIVEVFSGAIPAQALSVAAQHLNVRFEFLGTSAPSSHGVNEAVVTTSRDVSSYLTGWMAGFTNQDLGKHFVGWLNNSGNKPNPQTAKALLSGLYAADPTAVIVPVGYINSSTGNVGTTGSGSGVGNATNNTTSPSAGQSLVNNSTFVPGVCIEADALSKSNASLIAFKHGRVFSTVAASGPMAATPVPPNPLVLEQDLTALVKNTWKSGNRTSSLETTLWVDPKTTSPTALAALQNLEQGGVSATEAQTAWKAIPKARQVQWQQLLGF